MKRYLNAAWFALVLVLLGITWLLPEELLWLAVKTVLLVLVIVLLVWRIVAGRNRRVRQEQSTPRVYTWQYKLYRVLSILSAILYLVGGLITIVSGFLFLNAGWCIWLFAAGLVLGVFSLVLSVWDETIDPA